MWAFSVLQRAINERQSVINESNISRFTNFSFMILKSNKGIVQPYLNKFGSSKK